MLLELLALGAAAYWFSNSKSDSKSKENSPNTSTNTNMRTTKRTVDRTNMDTSTNASMGVGKRTVNRTSERVYKSTNSSASKTMGSYYPLSVDSALKVISDINSMSYELICREIVPPNESKELKIGNFTVWKRYQEKGFKLYLGLHTPKNIEATLLKANMNSFYFDAEFAVSRACDKAAIEELITVYVDWLFNNSKFDKVKVLVSESDNTWIDLDRTDIQIIYIDYTIFHNLCIEAAARLKADQRQTISGSEFNEYFSNR